MKTCTLFPKTRLKRRIKDFWGNKAINSPLINRTFTFLEHSLFKDINGLRMRNFTPEDLLLYLYKESSPQLTAAITQALQLDWTLREKFNVLKTSMLGLEKIQQSPRTEAILNILNYAREKSSEMV